jgi:hypothetical protein
LIVFLLVTVAACRTVEESVSTPTFQDDVQFMEKYVDVVVLEDSSGTARVAVVPAWQGRVMTSTNGGPEGSSFGWINYDLISSGKTLPHINPYGGEDRFWMGPEGGQFSIFFRQGDPFDLKHWQTPACIDTQGWDVSSASRTSVTFSHTASLPNYSGTRFELQIDRRIALLGDSDVKELLGQPKPQAVEVVGFASENSITNVGDVAWKHETGLLSIWILGMYVPSPTTTVIIPFRKGSEAELGQIVNDSYFGKVPGSRLQVQGSNLYFKADGEYRSKIGLSPQRARSLAGSYDSSRHLLTIVTYNQPEGVTDYVNSMREIQEMPYAGDVINSYNDGPPEPGVKPMGPFYELETSSPAAALSPGANMSHTHSTYHFTGPELEIDEICRQLLGVGLDEIPGDR